MGKVVFPCHIARKNVLIEAEVIEADFPLLLGNSLLKKVEAVLYISRERAVIMGSEVGMVETSSGHFSIQVEHPKDLLEFSMTDKCLMTESCSDMKKKELTRKEIERLHHYFGHKNKQLGQLIKNSNRFNDEVKKYLEDVQSSCKSCKVNQKAKPVPKVAFPRATRPNEVVSLDLKDFIDGNDKYILYCVDLFSRFTVGALIRNKKPSTIGAVLMEKWVSVMGVMDFIHSDRGGEFCCEELVEIAEYLGVRSTFTAAYSPNQNGTNERNHAVCDNMISKMRAQDPDLSASISLTWALMAKNTLQNVSGFSPFQIMFGKNPTLPSVYTAGPSGLEEVAMAKSVANNINAMHLAREAFIEGESDKKLKAALRERIYKRGTNIAIGEWIYFKNQDKWRGPVKVAAKDGKNLYVVRGGRFLTVNSDHADIAKFEGEILDRTTAKENIKEYEPVSKSASENVKLLNEPNEGEEVLSTAKEVEGVSNVTREGGSTHEVEPEGENEHRVDQEESATEVSEIVNDKTNAVTMEVGEIRKNYLIAFKRKMEDPDWEKVKIVSRAGKAGKKYDTWWNTVNLESGQKQVENFGDIAVMKKIEESGEVSEEEVFIMTIPRHLHNERRCQDAKQKELQAWDEFEVYEEVENEGQVKLGTNWVLTEKLKEGERAVKARLTVRGDQEDASCVRKDSPTVRKGNIKIFCAVAAREGWNIKSSDVTCAFLQGAPIEREVFVVPPKERRIPGMLWQLKKTCLWTC